MQAKANTATVSAALCQAIKELNVCDLDRIDTKKEEFVADDVRLLEAVLYNVRGNLDRVAQRATQVLQEQGYCNTAFVSSSKKLRQQEVWRLRCYALLK